MSARGLVLAAILSALLLAAGCGSSGSKEVTVQTGSLSKAEFIEKADAICKAARADFVGKLEKFFKTHQAEIGNKDKEGTFLSEMLETLLAPNIEGQIEQISKLGAPAAYAPEASSFLNALQERIEEAHDDPTKLTATPFAFKKAEDVAAKVGLKGCSESFA